MRRIPLTNLIYGLFDPRTGQLRYVGKSTSGLQRPRAHRWFARRSPDKRNPRLKWIRELHAAGLDYEIRVLEEFEDPRELEEAERFHIAYWRSLDIDLLNRTDGGEGCVGRVYSEATKSKMRAAWTPERRKAWSDRQRGKTRSAEFCVRTSARLKGHTVSEATREKLRRANLGKKASPETLEKLRNRGPEWREKLRQANLGKKASAEARRNMSLAHRGYKHSAAARANMVEATRKSFREGRKGGRPSGFRHTEETKEKLRQAQLGKKASSVTRAKMRVARLAYLAQRGAGK